jgi:TolB-like protein
LAAEVTAAPQADRAKPLNTKSRNRSAPLAAALLALFVVNGWFLERGAKREAGHLSIAVAPFANLSGDPSQDYLAGGITENLTTELFSHIRDSFVGGRAAVFANSGGHVDAKQIGREVGVRYVLEGSVQRDGNRVRVNARLIEAESGRHLWDDRFEEDMADLFKLEDEVVARLANSLGYPLMKAEAEKGAHSKNPDAIDLTMRGFALLAKGAGQPPAERRARKAEARPLFDEALKIDPNNADALALLWQISIS